MRLYIQIAVIFLSIAGCVQRDEQPDHNIPESAGFSLVDIRIYDDGRVLLNGNSTSYSALPSLVESLNISEQTLVRFIFVMGEQTPLVYETTRLMQQYGTFNIYKIILPRDEFYVYLKQNIHIDILNNGRVLFDGNEIFAEDLTIALNGPDIAPDKNIIITLPENFSKSTHIQVLEILDSLRFKSIEYADLAEY